MPDHDEWFGDPGELGCEIGDERFGGEFVGSGTAVTGGVEGVHVPVPA